MRPFLAIVVAGLAALALTSCSRSSVLILTDPYWNAAVLNQNATFKAVERSASESGIVLSVRETSLDPKDVAGIQKLIAKLRATNVILSPLLSSAAVSVARSVPKKRIAAFLPEAADAPDNLVSIVSLPAAAFREAGVLASQFGGSPTGREGRVVALFSDDPASIEEETAFRAGYDSTATSLTILTANNGDRTRLRSELTDQTAGKVGLYVLAAPGLNSFAFDVLKTDHAPIMTENWIGGALYSDKVVYSIDEDIVRALRKTVERMTRGADKDIGVLWNVRAVGRLNRQ